VRPLICPRHQSLYSRFTTLMISPLSNANSLGSVGSNECSARTRVTKLASVVEGVDELRTEVVDLGDDSTVVTCAGVSV
jgi:hypothetical protein